ncbi:MAG TPA: YbaK/EbsC family protein [Roseiflexaceae bacterium]|nr:YbaK/EbsC family protein [Roseiflexaceae bacterium]
MPASLSASAQRVQDALTALGLPCRVVELPGSTRTAQEAADAVGCTVGQIVKSLIFRGARTDTPILVLASGANRVDERRLGELAGEPIAKADAAFVRAHTGFAIGGVAPLGHPAPLKTYIDADLLQYTEIWAAAGTPNAVFALTPADLEAMTKGQVLRVT